MAQAPFCDLTVPIPPGNPKGPSGFKKIPPNASLPQVINIINQNFFRMFPIFPPSSGGDSNWSEVPGSRVTQTVRVFHKNQDGSIDKTQFIDFVRIQRVTMQDKNGASWIWSRGSTGDGDNVQVLP